MTPALVTPTTDKYLELAAYLMKDSWIRISSWFNVLLSKLSAAHLGTVAALIHGAPAAEVIPAGVYE